MRWRPSARTILPALGLPGAVTVVGSLDAVQTNLQETMPIVWVILAISVAGAALTYALLTYALWKFRDPSTRGRRYG